MSTGWQPPHTQPGTTSESSDQFNRTGPSPARETQPRTPAPTPPTSNFFSRFLAHSAATSNFPDAIDASDIALLESTAPEPAKPALKPVLPSLPKPPKGSTYKLLTPTTDQGWLQ